MNTRPIETVNTMSQKPEQSMSCLCSPVQPLLRDCYLGLLALRGSRKVAFSISGDARYPNSWLSILVSLAVFGVFPDRRSDAMDLVKLDISRSTVADA